MSERIRAVVFDLDGVIRYWDHLETAEIERRHGIDEGAIYDEAFAANVVGRAIVGEVTDEQWRKGVATRLRERFGTAGERAAQAWSERTGVVSSEMVDLVRQLRGKVVVALLSNATTRLDRDLAREGLDDEFDAVFNTSVIGVAKPDPAIYDYVSRVLNVAPAEWLFIDDRRENVENAREGGVEAHCFQRRDDLMTWLATFPELGPLT